MTDRSTLAPMPTPKDMIRASLAHARHHAAREIRFGTDGIAMVGFFGVPVGLTRDGKSPVIDLEGVVAELTSKGLFEDKWSKDDDNDRDFDDLGTWVRSRDEDGRVTLKARKLGAPCLEGVAEFPKEDLARLRSLYRRGDVDVFVFCEGEGRARDLALALTAERKVLGLPTALDLEPAHDPYAYARQPKARDHKGPEAFDPIPGEPFPAWEILHQEPISRGSYETSASNVLRERMSRDDAADGGRVYVAVSSKDEHRRSEAYVAAVEERGRPSIVVNVRLVKSSPVATVRFNTKALALSREEHGFADAPWDALARRREARAGSRPEKARTWHQTTEAVAEAYVARVAPRGHISGNSLFFHGPVAFSVWKNNPIAALVESPGGETVMFMGRVSDCAKPAIVSMAQGDISRATGSLFPIIHMDDLGDFLKLGDVPLGDVAWRVGQNKAEENHPRTCSIDVAGLSEWFRGRHEKALAAREHAYRTKVTYPTGTQADSHRALLNLALFRDAMAERFAIELAKVGDVEEYRASHAEASGLYQARQAELQARRDAAATERDEEVAAGPRR